MENFEEITYDLTEYEIQTVLPLMIRGLKLHIGPYEAVTNKQICAGLKKGGVKTSEPRVRRMINHIRVFGLVKGVMATSKGYYITTDKKELESYIRSLDTRISAIQTVRNEMTKQMNSI